ncbi:hypothetical protein ACJIZ3_013206 [Penstemon smallii]|uniref:Uncharacterized protein n=1 Tax=Penstemon smallii TaxID=265156 RepID=A0ABD3UP95_9LAMI
MISTTRICTPSLKNRIFAINSYLIILSGFLLVNSDFPLSQMKVHPMPRKRNITLRYDVGSALSQANSCLQKKLRRLPHVFSKVVELPFHSSADVAIDETSERFRFTVATDDITGDVRADAIEIYPGIAKIVIRGIGEVDTSGTELGLNLWRYRLPACTRPELASAAYHDGELVWDRDLGACSCKLEGNFTIVPF